ncbi:MAG: DUF4136 domain-containing protein [Balneolaceae bacterium]|nr:DUF4136 domain-containing protein [Balneolaceae bacterium]
MRTPAVNYDQYQTYQIKQGNVESSENPIFRYTQLTSRITRYLTFHLPSAGLDPPAVGQAPDLTIYYYVTGSETGRTPVQSYKIGWRAAPFIESGENFRLYRPNTLVLDVVDRALDELVWRGSVVLKTGENGIDYRALSSDLGRLLRSYPALPEK